MKLVVGLGNPGKKYKKTRHNAGFLLVDMLRVQYGFGEWTLSKKFNAEISDGTIGDEKVVLAKPMTYMNNSGQSVGLIAQFYKLSPANVLVIQDEKDIPLGETKIQTDRGHAGHNGIRSIIDHLGTKGFTRIRVGVAPANERKMKDTATYVLGKFGIFEKRTLKAIGETIQTDIDQWLAN